MAKTDQDIFRIYLKINHLPFTRDEATDYAFSTYSFKRFLLGYRFRELGNKLFKPISFKLIKFLCRQ